MSRAWVFAFVVVSAVTLLSAAPPATAPDFWYVVPDAAHAAGANRVVRGIVVPSAVSPTVRTSPEGSVVSWQRPDGTRQSFVVQGVSSFTFEPGPLKGTTYVPFGKRKLMQYNPDDCCACGSWLNMEESFDLKRCVEGCIGCSCEACVCGPGYPCPLSARRALTLVAHNDPAAIMTLDVTDTAAGTIVAEHDGASVEFRGKALSVGIDATGRTEFVNPDSISIPGHVASRAIVRGNTAYFSWSTADTTVIVEQPRAQASPSYRDGTIDLQGDRTAGVSSSRRLAVEPVADRCSVCGTHPNSGGDNEAMVCIPGNGTCYRCISWECFAPAQ